MSILVKKVKKLINKKLNQISRLFTNTLKEGAASYLCTKNISLSRFGEVELKLMFMMLFTMKLIISFNLDSFNSCGSDFVRPY